MQYTPHYNLNLPEGTDIVNPLIQDNPNYSAIDTALYDNKLRVIGTATHTKVGTNHSIVLADSDIPVFRFVATGDYVTGDTFSVDGVTVTLKIADGSSLPTGAFKINSSVLCILDGTILNLINVDGIIPASSIPYSNSSSGLNSSNLQDAIDELAEKDLIRVTYSTTTDTISMATITVNSNYKIVSVFSKRTYYIERYCINESNDYTAYVKLSDYNGAALPSGTNVDFVVYCIKA